MAATKRTRDRRYDRKGRELTDITIRTRVPEKWLFVDQETGEVWERVDDQFKPAGVSVLVLPKLFKPA